MQKKGSNWKFLVGAVAGAFIGSRFLKNSQPVSNNGKTVGVNSAPASNTVATVAVQDPSDSEGGVLTEFTREVPAVSKRVVSEVPENKMEYYFGYLPVRNFLIAIVVAFIFKFIGLGMMVKFQSDNSSADNIYVAVTHISWFLIAYTILMLITKAKGCVRWLRNALTIGVTFFFDVAFFSSAFIIAGLLPKGANSVRDAWFVAFIVVASFLLNHLLLMLEGKNISTVKAVKELDKFFSVELSSLNPNWILLIMVFFFLAISTYYFKYGVPFASYFV